MPFVNEKFLRFALSALGIAALAMFGWKMVDFARNRVAYTGSLGDEDLVRIRRGFSQGESRTTSASHLEEYPAYSVIQDLNITGYVPPIEVDTGPSEPIRRGIRARDLEVPFVQYPSAAWVQPAGAQSVSGSETVPGDLIAVDQEFEVDSHPGVRLLLAKVELDKITLKIVESGEELIVRAGDMPLDMDLLTGGEGEGPATEMPRRPTPEYTAQDDTGIYLVGSADAKDLRGMSEEELLSAVSVRPARNPLTNEVEGLRVQRLNHPAFQRMGLQADDIVMSVNGEPALERDAVIERMRDFEGDLITLEIKRLGGVRTIRYRLPR